MPDLFDLSMPLCIATEKKKGTSALLKFFYDPCRMAYTTRKVYILSMIL